ncbi:hypothetical protein [Maledivibacter halophilus]|uniref:Uncharacterized protein n=1 Tax=Maledivibacter halophilus TaxID=36842 RepID=A0A1T5LYW7_9FIRM|nr:hypothetical protein [Maledivibacter halophilus]SKC81073.1 hypothetical protein SAMN02194393_03538 [Maledivibacter halophilus]
MDIMFYVTIVLLGIIILSSAGYLMHYFVNNRKSSKNTDGRKM